VVSALVFAAIAITPLQATKQLLAAAEAQLRQLTADSKFGQMKQHISEVLREQASVRVIITACLILPGHVDF
jgi:hypothetical protein